jgi:sugar/nucleoside kinase (ribokinase family)
MMKKHDLCCVGHITLDKIVTPKSSVFMPGGTSFYFSRAISCFDDIDYTLVTAVGATEMQSVEDLRKLGIEVKVMPSKHSVYFENSYGENPDERSQRVLAKADPFTIEALKDTEAEVFHLGSLLADDFPAEVVKYLAGKGLVSADSQGYLREVRDKKVYAVDWSEKKEVLKYMHFLKANEHEMEVLTGHSDTKGAALQLYDWGVKEVLLTFGSLGSVIYDGSQFYLIPAYTPNHVVDATGCGDTYMTGYLYKRSRGASIEESGKFAAAMSTLKIEHHGAFNGTKDDILKVMANAKTTYPKI